MVVSLPTQARIVIVGGGIVGCSVAYHLTKLGWNDVVVLEQGRLTSGTTWHAAGLVGQLRANRTMTRLSQYGTDLYSRLEAETGLATGWKGCGSLSVAQTPERITLLKRSVAQAASFGVEAHFITPKEAGDLWPLMRIDDLQGAVWLPGDGKANPTDLTQSLAKGARNGGAKFVEGVRVTGFERRNGRVVGVKTADGDIACELVVNCAGQWARQLGKLAGVNVPLHSAEHFYIVTKRIDGVTPDLPVLRDPDGFIYFKEEVGGLVMGGFEPEAKPWGMDGIPQDFEFQLLPEDWDQFEILMNNALHRTPCLETAEVRQLLNGPESFTPDGNFILGEAPECTGFYVAAGFNSAGIANAGGAGRVMAEWIAGGEPSMDLWDVDIRRFAGFHANAAHLRDRTVETLGLHYAMRWPRHELESVRGLRRSPLYDRLSANGARFGAKMGWERANYFAPGLTGKLPYSFTRPAWLDHAIAEQKAVRESVGLFDQTSFGKLLVQGRDALVLLQQLCARNLDVPIGTMVYTALLNRRGGFESDLTILRQAEQEFFIITGSAQPARDRSWIARHIGELNATVTDVTSAYVVLSAMGPNSQKLLERVSPGFERIKLAYGQTVEADLGYARGRIARMSYAGGPGYELYLPTEFAAGVYDALKQAGADLGIKDAGYYALDALRIEAGRRAFAAELGPDETPLEAGLMFAVDLTSNRDFIGRQALLEQKAKGTRKRLVMLTLDDADAYAWGGEPILREGKPVGELTSAGWSTTLNRMVGMGYVRSQAPIDLAWIKAGKYALDIAGAVGSATLLTRPAFAD
jgi:glycine cleavage system aminomethyltransferase T/glycine/D-amino acid oxidase-like deaminating enzyme